jgi:hypothetical protein
MFACEMVFLGIFNVFMHIARKIIKICILFLNIIFESQAKFTVAQL